MYDYLIVGSGLFGSVFAHEMVKKQKKVLVIDKRDHLGGNVYTENRDGINLHLYGAHIFHTDDKEVWDYINRFAEFNHYVNSPVANYKGKLYNLPFNMNTFYQLWGCTTPEEVERKLDEVRVFCEHPENLEQQALSLAGKDIYEILIKEYTEKQWGRACTELPPSIIRRLPFRMRFDNNYFNHPYQGIPKGGYTPIIEKLLEGCDTLCGVDFNRDREKWMSKAEKVLYTGTLDSLFDYRFGELEYRSEKFDHKRLEEKNHQGVAVMNYTSHEVPYTRSIEHKFFEFGEQPVTWVSYEYPVDFKETGEPYYPINNERNSELHQKYLSLAEKDSSLLIGGRLAEYRYYDMDKTIKKAKVLADGCC